MEYSELERELATLHAQAWGWTLACCGRDRELAKDVLQSAYLRIIGGRATFRGESTVKTWLFGVIRVTALEQIRKRRVWRLRHDEPSTATLDVADPTKGADVALEDDDRRRALVEALETVSPRQREVLQLVFYHDMTIEEAARVMGVSLGAARTHYARGKDTLADKLIGLATR